MEAIPKKILVVDDDEDIILTIKEGIESLTGKYQVYGVRTGEDCIGVLKKGIKPDLIILDVMLPQMDGWQTYSCLRENKDWYDIPVIFLTALDDETTMRKGMKTDAFCLKKPFEIGQLKEIIDNCLDPV